MFNYWKKIDALHHINRLLFAFVIALFFIVLVLSLALLKAPKHVEFWLTPQMAANGGLIKANEIPNEYVHGFVSALLPTLFTWSDNHEFMKNLNAFHYYFTPRHQHLMAKTYNAYEEAQLFNRMQTASLYRFLEPSDIKRINQNTWEVHLILHITQRLNTSNPMMIADKVLDYHVRVVKVNTSKLQNPFELALDGYATPEHLITDLLSGEPHVD